MATERPKFKRRQYLVSKKFQLTYVGLILLLMFATAALCSYVVYYTSMILMGEKLANVYPQGRLVSIVKIVNFRILLSVLLITPLVAVIGIFLSHRIAGPIFRMTKFLNYMASGELGSRITLRKGDELQPLADGINYLSESLRSTIKAEKARLTRIISELEDLKKASASKSGDASAINAAISRLDSEINGLAKEVDRYKL